MAATSQIKVVLLGESGVGKTCIVQKFAYDKFKEGSAATLGAMFISKILDVPETGAQIKYQIWDTAGQEKYRSLAAMYYQDAAAAILVYDITKKDTFDGITFWINELKSKAPDGIKIAIAANKSDLVEQEEVNFNDAKKFADSNSAIFKMTSAKDGTGIKELFLKIAEECGQLSGKPTPTTKASGSSSTTTKGEKKGTKLQAPTKTEKKDKKKCC